jgi:hypothetical protein
MDIQAVQQNIIKGEMHEYYLINLLIYTASSQPIRVKTPSYNLNQPS